MHDLDTIVRLNEKAMGFEEEKPETLGDILERVLLARAEQECSCHKTDRARVAAKFAKAAWVRDGMTAVQVHPHHHTRDAHPGVNHDLETLREKINRALALIPLGLWGCGYRDALKHIQLELEFIARRR